jgi:hypothetical protein
MSSLQKNLQNLPVRWIEQLGSDGTLSVQSKLLRVMSATPPDSVTAVTVPLVQLIVEASPAILQPENAGVHVATLAHGPVLTGPVGPVTVPVAPAVVQVVETDAVVVSFVAPPDTAKAVPPALPLLVQFVADAEVAPIGMRAVIVRMSRSAREAMAHGRCDAEQWQQPSWQRHAGAEGSGVGGVLVG